MSILVVVESPAKAKTIGKYLGTGYIVKASVGHVRDLPKSNKAAIDIEAGFVPNYQVTPGKEKVIADLKAAAKKADEVLLATDPDREGEAIAWHVAELIKSANKHIRRVVFYEITKNAVTEAIEKPRAIDNHLRKAQEARRVLDRLVGYDLSGLIWKKVRYGLSAGRVQSPALRILMEREREIRAFKPEIYWTLTAHTKTKRGADLLLTCSEEPRDKKLVDAIVKKAESMPWNVFEVKETKQERSPRPPYTTSTLQQSASTRLGFSPSRTMRAAQKLYEAGDITYMRTDSVNMSADAQKQILGLVASEYGTEYVGARSYKTTSKSAQEAHEAIRPTDVSKRSAGASDDEHKVYDLIWRRAVSSQMSSASLLKTRIAAGVDDKDVPVFAANGSRLLFDGWLKVDSAARGEDTEVPEVKEKESLDFKKIETEEKTTQPPSRYSEAGLIKELEKRGIGRPSTYASIMKTIVDRGYVEKQGRTLIPTDTGDVVSSFLEENFAQYISDDFTSEMENELDEIASGDREYEKTLKDFYGPFSKDVASKEDAKKITDLGPAPKEFPCPICGAEMVMKLGRGGVFMSCVRFPDCTGARTKDGSEMKPSESIGIHEASGEPIFVLDGRFGPYVQLGDPAGFKGKGKKKSKPRRASIPKDIDPTAITIEQATKLLILPRELGEHPDTGKTITANIGKFGPYVVHEKDFRSLKDDDVYTIELPRALEIFKEPKAIRRGAAVAKELGEHPRTKKPVQVFKSKSGLYLKKGFKHIYLPEETDLEKFTLDAALEMLKAK